jgi:hypothetical protein
MRRAKAAAVDDGPAPKTLVRIPASAAKSRSMSASFR